MYYLTKKYEDKVDELIGEKQKKEIRNFYAKLKSSQGVDVEKIVINCNEGNNLTLENPLIIKLLLYEFAKKYYTVIERLDKDNWENEIPMFNEKEKRGNKEYRISKYLRAVICVYWDFVDHERLLVNNTIEQGYHLIGKLLTLGGFDAYNEEMEFKKDRIGYQSEKDFYDQNLKKRWKKERTK